MTLTYQNWKANLEHQGQENACSGLLVRGHQINGRSVDSIFVRYPYRGPENFQEFLDVLATAAGRPPVRHPFRDFSMTTVQTIPTNTSRQELVERIKAVSFFVEDSR